MKLTKAEIFENSNIIFSTIFLKDGRKLLTTSNGFKYWVVNKNQTKVEEITESQYNKSKLHRVTKKNK